MRVPQMLSDFFDWRWAPCVGLTAGSLAFVALALLFIPARFAGEPRIATTLSSFDNPRPQRALYASSLARSVTEAEEQPEDETRAVRPLPQSGPPSVETGAALRRGFSPIVDRPAPPPPPPPPVTVEPPAPAPVTLAVQPEPLGPSRAPSAQ